MDVLVMWEHAYFKRICFIASTLTVHKFISYSSTGARPALHLLVMTDQYPIPNLLTVFFLQYCLMNFSSSLEGIYRQKQVTVIQTACTTLQITNLKHSWVWLQSSYVWCLQYFIKHIMTSSINLDLKFSVLKLCDWTPWQDVTLLVVKASQVLWLMIDTVLL